jgi:3-hydroxyacyl-[acyl-carrier-protein] dehydratase
MVCWLKVVGENQLGCGTPDMRFNLVDRIVAIEPGRSLRAVKQLALGEEYLGDHFPTFPVMPGVLMLQTLVEAASWLLRATDDFRHSMIALREVKNVKYGAFMEPGRRMEVTVELAERQGTTAILKGKGECEGQTSVTARFALSCYNLRDRDPELQTVDEQLTQELRRRYRLLRLATQQKDGTVCG